MSLDEFAKSSTEPRRGFLGVMDKISDEHRAEAVEGYHRGIPAPTIRAWLQEQYPDIRFTSANCDGWLSKNHPRFRRG